MEEGEPAGAETDVQGDDPEAETTEGESDTDTNDLDPTDNGAKGPGNDETVGDISNLFDANANTGDESTSDIVATSPPTETKEKKQDWVAPWTSETISDEAYREITGRERQKEAIPTSEGRPSIKINALAAFGCILATVLFV